MAARLRQLTLLWGTAVSHSEDSMLFARKHRPISAMRCSVAALTCAFSLGLLGCSSSDAADGTGGVSATTTGGVSGASGSGAAPAGGSGGSAPVSVAGTGGSTPITTGGTGAVPVGGNSTTGGSAPATGGSAGAGG